MENAGIPDAQTIIVAIKLVVVLALLCFLCSASLFLVRKESSAHSLFLFLLSMVQWSLAFITCSNCAHALGTYLLFTSTSITGY